MYMSLRRSSFRRSPFTMSHTESSAHEQPVNDLLDVNREMYEDQEYMVETHESDGPSEAV